jgi:hypothetical protein
MISLVCDFILFVIDLRTRRVENSPRALQRKQVLDEVRLLARAQAQTVL